MRKARQSELRGLIGHRVAEMAVGYKAWASESGDVIAVLPLHSEPSLILQIDGFVCQVESPPSALLDYLIHRVGDTPTTWSERDILQLVKTRLAPSVPEAGSSAVVKGRLVDEDE